MLLLLLLLGNLCFLFKKPLTSADLILSGEILPPGGCKGSPTKFKDMAATWLLLALCPKGFTDKERRFLPDKAN